MLSLMHFSLLSLKNDITLAQDVSKIEAQMLQLRLYEKQFLTGKKEAHIAQFNDQVATIQLSIENLRNELKNLDISGQESIKLGHLLINYQRFFNIVVDIHKRIGLDPNSGLHGELNRAVIDAEQAMGDSVVFLKMMLQVRSSEKNYMLLQDEQYLLIFKDDLNKLIVSVESSFLIQAKKTVILSALNRYQNVFLSLAEEQKILGYKEDQALQRAMNDSAIKAQLAQVELIKKTNLAINEYISSITKNTYILFILALLTSILIGWFISRNIINAITHIKTSITKITESNDLTIVVSTKSNDELADVAKAFNYMLSNFQSLLASVKKLDSSSANKTEILTEDSFWADFTYEELPEDR
ncbi:hypothetical protein GCM10007916_25540 [Psychromonas marina]|uniref:HAMP domain-containing protein n=1 Tax=Psychromonas marina TaxID=88364 RepID=A0ABQ6E2S0_9GAMM|nr:methyl-accepting chemotaxis protein [Psychromonas marina]GLS91485.1 hypothetical protein GCM10007916_25540 [Psychromonas marina]